MTDIRRMKWKRTLFVVPNRSGAMAQIRDSMVDVSSELGFRPVWDPAADGQLSIRRGSRGRSFFLRVHQDGDSIVLEWLQEGNGDHFSHKFRDVFGRELVEHGLLSKDDLPTAGRQGALPGEVKWAAGDADDHTLRIEQKRQEGKLTSLKRDNRRGPQDKKKRDNRRGPQDKKQ